MTLLDSILDLLVVATIALPAAACVLLALCAWFGVALSERRVASLVAVAFFGATVCALSSIVVLALLGRGAHVLRLGSWFAVADYSFDWCLLADRLSLPFASFVAGLTGLIAAFSRRYLHREQGFLRFYLLLALFGAASEVVVLAASLDQVFFGWELVGLASALLIAFFHERPKPVEHGFRAYVTYRICDVGLLGALVFLHHTSHASFEQAEPWFALAAAPTNDVATLGALLLLLASMGKSAQVPLGGWLPRAMEGPTPSSAIFYGAISIHLGPYLLLRAGPLFLQSPLASWSLIGVGAVTAMHATFVGRVQTDIKSVLAYASMTQVGLIFVEIGFGFHYVPLVHICGHAAVRSLEILRSPSLLHDQRHLEQAVGRQVARVPLHVDRLVPKALRPWLYRHALERGAFDVVLRSFVKRVLYGLRRLDALDRRLTRVLLRRSDDPSVVAPTGLQASHFAADVERDSDASRSEEQSS